MPDSKIIESITALVGSVKMADLLGKLAQQLQDFIAHLENDHRDSAQLAKQAHGLVSSAGMLGFSAVSQRCSNLELAILDDRGTSMHFAECLEICVAALSEIRRTC